MTDSRHPLLTPEVCRAERTLTDRIGALAARTGLTIVSSLESLSGQWEVSDGSGTTAHDNGWRMLADLEARFPV